MMTSDRLLERRLVDRIATRDARIAVIGIGYVGLPLAVEFVKAGFYVNGVDLDDHKVANVNTGNSYIEDVSSHELSDAIAGRAGQGQLRATTSFEGIADADVVIITVPTPLSKTRHPDLSHIIGAVGEVSKYTHPGMLVILQSTTYPGTTHELVVPKLVQSRTPNFEVGKDLFVAFAPERVDPGRKDFRIKNTPKVVGGETEACKRVAVDLFKTIVSTVVPVDSPGEAEMVKLLENTFRAINIALVNEVAIMCDKLGLNVWNVIEAAATKPFGFMKFTPGPGIGGHCIPTDPQYLAWKLRSLNYEARFVGLAEEINLGMQGHVVDKVVQGLNDCGRPVKGSRILCLGVAYKPDVADIRESPALAVMQSLIARGGDVVYNDPHVREIHEEPLDMESVALDEAELRRADCVVILTAHSAYNWQSIVNASSLIVDTRNATRGAVVPESCRVVGI
jgi:UDP-N-acetyl-D-glucosamine dehydrogenase